jgi:geranylgeranyl diphosphate synthase, type I
MAMTEVLSHDGLDPRAMVEQRLRDVLVDLDEAQIDPDWSQAQSLVTQLMLRPAKRLRPQLLWAGYRVGGGQVPAPDGLWAFATGLEVLHTFMLVHDDVADQADTRRGGPALHRALGQGRLGENLAVVVGDHLFVRAVEMLFDAPMPQARAAGAHYLRICRRTAVGQYLDLALAARRWRDVTPFDALKVAELKTAEYSVSAPLTCGAMLAGAEAPIVEMLQKVGRLSGVAFQLWDDLNGLFGNPTVTGKPVDCDLREGKKSFPLLLAHRRASPRERVRIESLNHSSSVDEIQEVRDIVRRRGGLTGTQRAIDRTLEAARQVLGESDLSGDRLMELHSLFHPPS